MADDKTLESKLDQVLNNMGSSAGAGLMGATNLHDYSDAKEVQEDTITGLKAAAVQRGDKGIRKDLATAIRNTDIDDRKNLRPVKVAGGTTLFGVTFSEETNVSFRVWKPKDSDKPVVRMSIVVNAIEQQSIGADSDEIEE